MKTLHIQTDQREEIRLITPEVEALVEQSGIDSGVCILHVPHTTAGLAVNENADPDVRRDLLLALRHTIPEDLDFRHDEENSPAHLKSVLTGHSQTLLIHSNRLVLGRWQGIYLCEFDGPRSRDIHVSLFRGLCE